MLLRRPREPVQGQPRENTFEAMDEHSGERLGACTIFVHENDELFPSRPVRIYLDIEGSPVPDALLGAAVARAKEISRSYQKPCRIFTKLMPDDSENMETLRSLGFRDNDGVIVFSRDLPCEEQFRLPAGCVTVMDELDDSIEQKFFLERWNLLFGEQRDFDWLDAFRNGTGFKRILIVSPTGMVSECAIWQEDGIGRIGWIYTAKRWRRMNAAVKLLELACAEFARREIFTVNAEVQARIPYIMKVFEKAGFVQDSLIYHLPGIDIDP